MASIRGYQLLKTNQNPSIQLGDIEVWNNPFRAVSSTKLTRLNRLASEKSGIPGVIKKWLKRWIEFRASRILETGKSRKILIKISGRGTFEADECNGQMCVTYLKHYKTLYEPEIEAVLAAFLHEMDAFVDCGANWGYFTGKAIMTNPNLLCWAIEPSPRTFQDLKAMTDILGTKSQLNLLNAGASSCRSSFDLNESPFDSGTNHVVPSSLHDSSVMRVDCLTIDELTPPGKSLIKIDVEGHELEVLKGMTNLLNKSECIIVFEHWHDTADALAPFYIFLHKFGYSIYQIQTKLTVSNADDFTRARTTLVEPSLAVGGRYNLIAIHYARPMSYFRSFQ